MLSYSFICNSCSFIINSKAPLAPLPAANCQSKKLSQIQHADHAFLMPDKPQQDAIWRVALRNDFGGQGFSRLINKQGELFVATQGNDEIMWAAAGSRVF